MNTLSIFAQLAGYSFIHYIIVGIVIVAVLGIAYTAAKASGVPIPPWVITILWIVIVAVVAILAIKFLVNIV